MKHLFKIFVVIGFVLALATSASAYTAGTIPGGTAVNEFTQFAGVFGNPIGGYYGANIYLIGGPTAITLEYFGAEAGFNNEFNFGGIEQFAHTGGNTASATPISPSPIVVNNVTSGLLDFRFDVESENRFVENGSNPGNVGSFANFFVTFDPLRTTAGGPTFGQSVWLFLDDGGAGPDDNHDDMLVKLSITGGNFSVPEPGTMLLLGLGLLGFAGVGRKFKA